MSEAAWQLERCDVRGVQPGTQSIRTRYAVAGEAGRPPVVLLHGIGRSLEDWSESAPLAVHYRLYAPDLIGFGYTDKPDIPYTLDNLTDFVRNFLDAVGETGPVRLIGHSLGGAVAQTFAVRYPKHTEGLVLVCSAGFGKEVILALRLVTVPGLGELLLKPSRQGAERTVESLFYTSNLATEERVAHALTLSQQPGAARAFLATARNLGTWRGLRAAWRAELSERLAALEVPMLIVWGEFDEVLPAEHLEAASHLHPHAQTYLFKDTGHTPQLEQPAEFSRIVSNFLEAHA